VHFPDYRHLLAEQYPIADFLDRAAQMGVIVGDTNDIHLHLAHRIDEKNTEPKAGTVNYR